jgi:hypothetical protein
VCVGNGVWSAGTHALAESLRVNRTLTMLDLAGMFETTLVFLDTDNTTQQMASMLPARRPWRKRYSRTAHLHLCIFQVCVLERCLCLVCDASSDNGIGAASACAFAVTLKLNRTLTTLDLLGACVSVFLVWVVERLTRETR